MIRASASGSSDDEEALIAGGVGRNNSNVIQKRSPKNVSNDEVTTTASHSPATSPQPSRTAAMTRLRNNSNNPYKSNKHQSQQDSGSLPWTLLVFGVCMCVFNSAYIIQYVMRDVRYQPRALLRAEDYAILEEEEEEANEAAKRKRQQNGLIITPELENKRHILTLLHQAGYTNLSQDVIDSLPVWSDVTDLYGNRGGPVVVGYPQQCRKFQKMGVASDHFVSTAGTFNTGTNLMAELLIQNCHMPARMAKYGPQNRGVRWQVLWGKHTPVDQEEFRTQHHTYKTSANETLKQPPIMGRNGNKEAKSGQAETEGMKAENIFPAVTVRDPFKWMQSMCRHPYGAEWPHNTSRHCPNLIPDEMDAAEFPVIVEERQNTVQVKIQYAEFQRHHASLVHFWNEWYKTYWKADFPKLLVRFEDLVFYPQQVTKMVCECAGGQMNRAEGGKFHYVTESAKRGAGAHGSVRTSYLDALEKYGTEQGRYDHYKAADLQFAMENLDPDLLQLFKYKVPDESILKAKIKQENPSEEDKQEDDKDEQGDDEEEEEEKEEEEEEAEEGKEEEEEEAEEGKEEEEEEEEVKSPITDKQAREACAKVDHWTRDECIFDVKETGDLTMALAYV